MARVRRSGQAGRGLRAALALSALCVGWAGVACAQDASGWEIVAIPYVWVPGVKGDAGVNSQLPTVGVDLSSGDTLDALHFGLMGRTDARHDRIVASLDAFYTDLRADKSLTVHDRDFGAAKLKNRLFFATALAGYRVFDHGPMSVDLMGGVRVVNLDLDLAVSGPTRSLRRSTSETWIDPVVAARAHGPISGRWSYSIYGDIGGVGVGSELTWQLSGTIDYQAAANWTVSAGWRHLDNDYHEAGFLFDTALDGPIVSAAYRF